MPGFPRGSLVLGLLLLASTGCARNVIYAHRLPAIYGARPVTNVQGIDLSRLAGDTVSSELIERGDVLQVTVGSGAASDEMMTVPLRVSEDGVANIPLVGGVQVAGMELEGCEQAIRAAAISRNVYRNPQITVTLKQKRINRVTVLGCVAKPGAYDIPRSSSSLLTALVMAGGLTKDADSGVEIRRAAPGGVPGPGPGTSQFEGDRTAAAPLDSGTPAQLTGYAAPTTRLIPTSNIHVDLAEAAHSGQSGVPIRDGDVVMVTKKESNPIHVIGLVLKPGKYEPLPDQQLHVLDAIALAGGMSSQVADKIFVIRRVPDRQEPVVIQVSVRTAKTDGRENLALAPGDVVSVEQTPATVMLEALKNFVRFGVNAAAPVF